MKQDKRNKLITLIDSEISFNRPRLKHDRSYNTLDQSYIPLFDNKKTGDRANILLPNHITRRTDHIALWTKHIRR